MKLAHGARTVLFSLTLIQVCGLAWGVGESGAASGQARHPKALESAQRIEETLPGVQTYAEGERLTSLYGIPMGSGVSAELSAWSVLDAVAPALRFETADLIPGSLAGDNAHERPMIVEPATGAPRFFAECWRQQRDGLLVLDSDVIILTRNTTGYPVVLVRNNLRDLGTFHVRPEQLAHTNFNAAMDAASAVLPGIGDFSAPELAIFAGMGDAAATPALALVFTAQVGAPGQGSYMKYRIVADAATGAVLHTEELVHHADLTGTVQGLGTQGIKADICDAEVPMALPYLKVSAGGKSAFADATGAFTIPSVGTGNVTLQTQFTGKYFTLTDSQAATNPQVISQSVPVGSPALVTFNSTNTNPVQRDGVNAYVNANRVRDMVMKFAPAYPVISTQFDGGAGGLFQVNVNLNSTCNAYYDGVSINFFSAGGGCPSTAYYDVVHHEYGHHVVQSGGSAQDQYGEGTGDTMGVLLSDQPILGYGFQSDCNAGIRTASNTKTYPCSGEIHDCGQLISGCWWETRNAMVAASVPNYLDVVRGIAINAVALHRGGAITPQICIDALTLDDNDGDLSNGTPHSAQIFQGFGVHNMLPAAISSVTWPSTLHPFHGTPVTVKVVGGVATGAPVLHFTVPGGQDQSVTMTLTSASTYTGLLPALACQQSLTAWVGVPTNFGLQTDPPNAPASTRSISSGTKSTTFKDGAIYNNSWIFRPKSGTAPGAWSVGVPTGGQGLPAVDFDGDGRIEYTVGDVDGTSYAISPRIDASGGDAAVLSYARWFSNNTGANPGQDVFNVDISGNDGVSFTPLEVVGPTGPGTQGGWYFKQFTVPPVARTSKMRVRFQIVDALPNSYLQGAFDAVQLDLYTCPKCAADFNGDGFLDIYDFNDFVDCFESGTCPSGKTADFNADGFADIFDFNDFVTAFQAGC